MNAANVCRFRLGALWFLGCGLAGLALAQALPAADAVPGERVFKFRETSAFSSSDYESLRGISDWVQGQSADCQEQPCPAVKAYPEFASKKPIYGSIRFDERADEKESGTLYYFAIDESQGTGKGYDRLYFDSNRDLDLRNEAVLKPWRDHPKEAEQQYGGLKEQVVFESLPLNFDCGPAGVRAIQLLPRLGSSSYKDKVSNHVSFARTTIYVGDIELGNQQFHAILGKQSAVTGRLDSPNTSLLLLAVGRSGSVGSRRCTYNINATLKADGKFFTFAASPAGDELTVRPYQGELGTFEVGAGGRTLDMMALHGSLEAAHTAVFVGGEELQGSPTAARSCQVPVGDYLLAGLYVHFGRLMIHISVNYHADGKPWDIDVHPRGYPIAVRMDKPFVLDFSNQPEVLFASPAKDSRVKLGETLEVKAVLVDPKLNFMIRTLEDPSRKETKSLRRGSYTGGVSLDPHVVITRANGEKVAEGVMPFG